MIGKGLLSVFISIGALLIMGLICFFLMIFNAYKESLWEEIYEKYIKGDENE